MVPAGGWAIIRNILDTVKIQAYASRIIERERSQATGLISIRPKLFEYALELVREFNLAVGDVNEVNQVPTVIHSINRTILDIH